MASRRPRRCGSGSRRTAHRRASIIPILDPNEPSATSDRLDPPRPSSRGACGRTLRGGSGGPPGCLGLRIADATGSHRGGAASSDIVADPERMAASTAARSGRSNHRRARQDGRRRKDLQRRKCILQGFGPGTPGPAGAIRVARPASIAGSSVAPIWIPLRRSNDISHHRNVLQSVPFVGNARAATAGERRCRIGGDETSRAKNVNRRRGSECIRTTGFWQRLGKRHRPEPSGSGR